MALHEGHVALVTGANHGIGAATAVALARDGVAVVVTYLTLHDEPDTGQPEAYRAHRAADGADVVRRVEAVGGRCVAVEADLAEAGTIPELFDLAERELGPVDVLVHNATGWVADSFTRAASDRLGRHLAGVTAETVDQQFAVDARAGGLLIAEFAGRHSARGADWGRIVTLTSGGPDGFPEEVSYGAAKAALVSYTMSAAAELAPLGVTANAVHPPVTDTGWVTDAVRRAVADSDDHEHVARPEDVADVIAYLAGPDSWLVSGNVLRLR